jgi:anti-sigma B factor antagonist
MDILQRLTSNVLIVEIKTELASQVNVDAFSKILRGQIEKGNKNVVVDLSDIHYFNSSHIGMLISGYTTVVNGRGDMRLASVSERVLKALDITRLNLVFDIYTTVDEAVSSYD